MVEEVKVQGLWFEVDIENNEAKVIQYKNKNKYKDNVEIPQAVGYKGVICLVKCINEQAFAYCDRLASIIIPNTVSNIGIGAFKGCNSLTAINIPEKVSSINDFVFDGCCSLISISIPERVTYIGAAAFRNCSHLTSIIIPNNVTIIDGWAFSRCSRLKSVTIGKNVNSISNACFNGCSKLVNVICLPDKVPNTSLDAFDDSGIKLSLLHVPSIAINLYKNEGPWSNFFSIKIIREDYLNREFERDGIWYKFTSIYNEVEVIKYKVKQYMGDIQIPQFVVFEDIIAYVTGIGEWAFSQCKELRSIVIPDSIKYIKMHAFEYCEQLNSITIPNSVMYIERDAFQFCRGLRSIVIPNSITEIACEAFCGCINITSVKLPNSIVKIYSGAFMCCNKLKSITIPDSVKIIGLSSFCYCNSLSFVRIGKNVCHILGSAFEKCPKLRDVICSAVEVPRTSEDAFEGSCSEETSLYVPGESIIKYKVAKPWNQFNYIGNIREID